jgi:uncharacterized damage-inducible protein DinB
MRGDPQTETVTTNGETVTETEEAVGVTSKAQLLERMRAERARWEATINAVEKSRLTEPGFAGVWSVRDVIAHITAYERWLLDNIEAWERGVPAAKSVISGKDLEARNHAAHEQTLRLSLGEVQAQARQVWQRLLAAVERTPEADLLELERAPTFVTKGWGRDTRLWEAIDGLTWEHYDEHYPNFAAWTKESADAANGV